MRVGENIQHHQSMSENQNKEMSFLDHLEILRWVLIRSVIATFMGAVTIFVFMETIFTEVILAPTQKEFLTNRAFSWLANELAIPALQINAHGIKIQNIDMSGQFTTSITIAIVGGIILAFPYIFWEFWKFIKPALRENEAKNASGAIFAVSSLFFMGILFGYYLIAPLSIDFLVNYKVSQLVENIISLDSYISTITSIVLAGGLVFELPVIIYFFSKIGLLSAKFLSTYRRHAIVVIIIIAAIITPPDVVSQSLVAIPLLLLYEVGILIAKNNERKRAPKGN